MSYHRVHKCPLSAPIEIASVQTRLLVFASRCICGLLKNKSRILVTHQLQFLKAADQILVLKEVCVPAEEKLYSVLSGATAPSTCCM